MVEVPHDFVGGMPSRAVVRFIEDEQSQPRHFHEAVAKGIRKDRVR
jgi:hypothetical protein